MNRVIAMRVWRSVFVAVMLVLFILAVMYVTPLVYPFLIGWILAYALNPLIRLLQNKARLPRWLAVTLSLLLFVAAAVTVVSALITRIVAEIIHLSQSINGTINWWRDEFNKFIDTPEMQDLINKISAFYNENPKYQQPINDKIADTANLLAQTSSDLVTHFFNGLSALLISLPNVLTIMVVVLLSAFFIGKDWNKHAAKLSGWLPGGIRKSLSTVWADLQKALFGYLRSQFIMISITAVVVIIGLLLLGVQYAITIGLLIGLVDLLPYLGVGAVMVPWIAYTFLYGDLSLGIGLSILYGVILVARQMIEPKVLASSVGLDPLPTLIAMFVGLKLFGVFGLIIGPVSLVILFAFHRANVFRDLYHFVMKGSK
ncbi:sporulation integral membrane protein YtvI [Paenibacillus sp. MMS18-CY102]|uniref:sporulation integral membrane protein YtvI n=1 Tax=Paenibacillus sp. MMS18-CY102 TaxID=2682849 RepID=UPI001365DD53|nr:sporulation integral membrane protein YtvI [Paenibacillus sp. MMS18-CY102]MWC28670.1 sporulation integral membrane protein YtvI [Paenibacillus sp. MMS18-CY102]